MENESRKGDRTEVLDDFVCYTKLIGFLIKCLLQLVLTFHNNYPNSQDFLHGIHVCAYGMCIRKSILYLFLQKLLCLVHTYAYWEPIGTDILFL